MVKALAILTGAIAGLAVLFVAAAIGAEFADTNLFQEPT
jgi:hypothetical protein